MGQSVTNWRGRPHRREASWPPPCGRRTRRTHRAARRTTGRRGRPVSVDRDSGDGFAVAAVHDSGGRKTQRPYAVTAAEEREVTSDDFGQQAGNSASARRCADLFAPARSLTLPGPPPRTTTDQCDRSIGPNDRCVSRIRCSPLSSRPAGPHHRLVLVVGGLVAAADREQHGTGRDLRLAQSGPSTMRLSRIRSSRDGGVCRGLARRLGCSSRCRERASAPAPRSSAPGDVDPWFLQRGPLGLYRGWVLPLRWRNKRLCRRRRRRQGRWRSGGWLGQRLPLSAQPCSVRAGRSSVPGRGSIVQR